MALINSEITPRSYEIIRDQLAAIVASELAQQAAITYDDLFLAPVYLQRAKNISVEECPLINIAVDSGKYDNQTIIDSDGEFTFFIDVFTTSTYTTTKRGDELSSKEAQRLAGVIQGILSNPQYVTLGFARPFIMRSKVVGFEPGTITKDESTNLAVVRITLSVKAIQNELAQQPISEFEISTQVFLYETELGYLYSGVGAPLPPPDPSCEPVNIYDADGNLLGTTASGGTFIVSNAIARLINTLSEEISQTEILAEATSDITAPNATYRVLNSSGGVLASGSIPSNKAHDITVSLATYTYSITDTDGTVLYAGNVTENLVKEIQDATVENSDASYKASILAEGGLILPDITVEIQNSQGTVVNTQTYPSVQDVSTSAPDAHINIKKTGDGTISSQSVPSGSEVNYEVANNAITVNSANGFQIKATDPLDVVLTDSNGSTLTPNSVTPNSGLHKVDIVLPANVPTYSSARLMKTGQTTSYATGDDGDLEIGRGSSFFTLISNNPFGNTNRFTDELGGQTYTKNIVIDWSTFDGTTVLGYKRTATLTASGSAGVGWLNAINGCSAISIPPYTSGWRLANLNEWNNVINIEYVNPLGYAPFTSFVWTASAHTSSTYKGAPSVYSWGVNNIGYNIAKDKNENSSCLAVRTFTVTGTTLS